MPMSKKEKAAFDALLLHHKLKGVIHWSPPVLPDVMPPKPGSGGTESSGFDFNHHSLRIFEAWSSTASHGEGPANVRFRRTSGSQNPSPLYSTRLLALRAMRHEVVMKAAKELLAVDAMIEAEEAGTAE